MGPHELKIWDVWFLVGNGVWSFSFPLTGNPGPGILPGTVALLPEEEEEKGLVEEMGVELWFKHEQDLNATLLAQQVAP